MKAKLTIPMKISLVNTLRNLILLSLSFVVMSCEFPDQNHRYVDFSEGTRIAVLDTKTSEVFVYDSQTDVWFSLGKPSQTPYTRANKPIK